MATAMTLPEKVIEQIGYSSAALEKAARDQQVLETTRTKVAALIPQVVDALVAGERIREDQREKAAKALADPVQALELLIKVAGHRNTGEQSLGTPAGQAKTAGANGRPGTNSLTQPMVGVRRTGQVKESSVRLFQRLGLTAPTEE